MSYRSAQGVLWPCDRWAIFFGLPGFLGNAITVILAVWKMSGWILGIGFIVSISWILIGWFTAYKHWNRKWKTLLEAPDEL